jgi:hypothetical protein
LAILGSVIPSRLILRSFIGLLAAAACLYVGDAVVLRFRMARTANGSPVESITRTRVLAIPQKNGKFDYQIDQQQPEETLTCVHSIFPHFGDPPCWYLKPRVNQPIPVS